MSPPQLGSLLLAPIRPASSVRELWSTPCMSCSFRLLPTQVRAMSPAQRLSWSDRGCPLHTAGDRCLGHVGGTTGENDDAPPGDDGSQLDRRARPVPSDPPSRGQEPGGLAAAGGDLVQPSLVVVCCRSVPWRTLPRRELWASALVWKTGNEMLPIDC
jgi:hypothetical protein